MLRVNFNEAVAQLDARTNYERSGRLTAPTLDRMEALMGLMAHPERSFAAIHITGTNGKTTCARAATEVLRAAGLRVGTYTSPHLQSIRERFLYDAQPIPEEDFVEAWRELAPYLQHFDEQGMPITWFEAATALAFLWFADKGVDVAVVEVGMGGTWDATNVLDAATAAITRVGLDHVGILGDTVEQIAREKAGVIKPASIVYIAEQEPAVADVLRQRCADIEAEMRAEPMAFAVEDARLAMGGRALTIRLEKDRYTDLFIPMFGEHFAHDAVLGAAAARAMLGNATLDEELVRQAFANIKMPGRMEVAHRSPLVVLDGAHNPGAAEALSRSMPSCFSYEKLTLVVGMMADKDARGVLQRVLPLANDVIVTRADSPRAMPAEDLAAIVRELGMEPQIVQNVADAISVAIERNGERDCVLVTGSLYTVGEARSKLIPKENT